MGKIFKLSFVLTILTICVVAFAFVANAQQRQGPQVGIIILPFQIHGGESAQRIGAELPEMLSSRLAVRGIPVLDTARTQQIIRERGIDTNNIASMRAFGRAAGATHVIYGTFNQLGEDISIDARLLRVSGTADPQPVFIERQGTMSVASAVDDLAGRISNNFSSRQVLSDVEVKGTSAIDPDVIIMRLTVRKGDPIDPQIIDQEVRRIWDLGFFSDVQANLEQRPEGMVLVYTVVEKPRIKNILTEGNSEIDEDDILAAMSSKSGSILNDKVLVQDLQKITELYRQEGFYLAKVSHHVQPGEGGTANLVIAIEEGNQLYIKEIIIDGAEQLSESDIKDELALRERGIFSWFTGTGVLQEEYLDRDSAAISAYYLDHGFLQIATGAPEVVYEEDGIIVTFQVREGPRFKLGEVLFDGDLIESSDALSKIITLDDLANDDEYFELTVMQDDAKKLMDYYGDYGYAYAETSGIPVPRGEGEPIVDVTYYIEKKQRMFINTVEIEGNTRTRDNVILREMRLVDGDLFESKKLRRSVERLRRLNYFEVADVDMIPTDVPDEIDLRIRVKEKDTGLISAGVGYSTYSKIGFGGTIMERNMFGKGYSLGFTGSFSDRYNRYNLSFVNPRLYDTDLSVGIDGYITRDYFDDFDKKTTGAQFSLAYPLGEFTSVYGSYRLEEYELYSVEDDASWLIRRSEGNHMASVVKIGFKRDTVDDPRRPTRGTIVDISTEYGGNFLGGSDAFIKPVIDLHAFYPLATNHVLHARFKAGAAFENSDGPVPVFERFWIGGMNSIRGYDYEELSPRDPTSPDNDHIGGDRMAFINLEYLWTFHTELGLAAVPFFDAGFNIDSEHHDNYFQNDLIAKSVGLEFRWNSPMGDLRFSYGYPLNDVYEKSNGRFDFSMGQSF